MTKKTKLVLKDERFLTKPKTQAFVIFGTINRLADTNWYKRIVRRQAL